MLRRVAGGVLDAAIDAAIAIALGLVLSQTRIGVYFAERAVVMLHIGTPGTLWKGPVPMIMGYLGTFVYVLPLAVVIAMLIRRRSLVAAAPVCGLLGALFAGSWELALLSLVAAVILLVRRFALLFSTAG